DSKRLLGGGGAGKGRQGPPRDAAAAAARPFACLVARGAAAQPAVAGRLAVSRPQSGRAAVGPPALPRCPRRRPGRRDQQARLAAHIAAQLRHPPSRARCRHSRDPDAFRSRDILPANTLLRGGFTTRSILVAARVCLFSGNTPTVMLSWSSFRSPTGRSPAYRRG